jgi:hypothetical protein
MSSTSSEKRTIKINPDLFKISDKNTSRKKRTSSTEIKVRAPKPIRNKTLRKSVLNMLRKNIRDRESNDYKNTIIHSSESLKPASKKSDTSTDEFKSEFERSIQYFNNLNDKEQPDRRYKQQHNTTFKRESNNINNPYVENNISTVLPDVFNEIMPALNHSVPIQLDSPPIQLIPTPKYGCLKGGSLPTYRTYMRGTQRNYGNILETPVNQIHEINQLQGSYSAPPLFNKPYSILEEGKTEEGKTEEGKTDEKIQDKQTILTEARKDLIEKRKKQQILSKKKSNDEKNKKSGLKYLKQKKIYKRTYHVGRSKVHPKVGVLISNKTVRQRISTSALHLKQTPMPEVKKFLIKKGFIKVGSIAPNDVLRQMYECAHLMCGQIENHNTENLLYNYFNDKE